MGPDRRLGKLTVELTSLLLKDVVSVGSLSASRDRENRLFHYVDIKVESGLLSVSSASTSRGSRATYSLPSPTSDNFHVGVPYFSLFKVMRSAFQAEKGKVLLEIEDKWLVFHYKDFIVKFLIAFDPLTKIPGQDTIFDIVENMICDIKTHVATQTSLDIVSAREFFKSFSRRFGRPREKSSYLEKLYITVLFDYEHSRIELRKDGERKKYKQSTFVAGENNIIAVNIEEFQDLLPARRAKSDFYYVDIANSGMFPGAAYFHSSFKFHNWSEVAVEHVLLHPLPRS